MRASTEEPQIRQAVVFAVAAAVLYGISAPASKKLLDDLPPVLLAALLYLGAGLGMAIVTTILHYSDNEKRGHGIAKQDWWYVVGMVVLDIAAPIFLMVGLTTTNAGSAALLNNFEIVATTVIALVFFREAIGHRTWTAIALITVASMILSLNDVTEWSLSPGSVFVLLAAFSWGLENNCTRMLSLNDPLRIVVIKGIGSGLGSLGIALALGQRSAAYGHMAIAAVLGFVAYGLGIYLYISAQRHLGAARTSAYYAAAPFIGVTVSWIVLHEPITASFAVALVVMATGSYLAATENHTHRHVHAPLMHTHSHTHSDGHHTHEHDGIEDNEHSHEHLHETVEHDHRHTPDMHHSHPH